MEDDRFYADGHPYAGWVRSKYVNIFTYEGRLYNLEMTRGPHVRAFAARLIESLNPIIKEKMSGQKKIKPTQIAWDIIKEYDPQAQKYAIVRGTPIGETFWYNTLQHLITEYITDNIIKKLDDDDPARGPFEESFVRNFPHDIAQQVPHGY